MSKIPIVCKKETSREKKNSKPSLNKKRSTRKQKRVTFRERFGGSKVSKFIFILWRLFPSLFAIAPLELDTHTQHSESSNRFEFFSHSVFSFSYERNICSYAKWNSISLYYWNTHSQHTHETTGYKTHSQSLNRVSGLIQKFFFFFLMKRNNNQTERISWIYFNTFGIIHSFGETKSSI